MNLAKQTMNSMKPELSKESEKPSNGQKTFEIARKRKNYTDQLLQFLARQTDSDKRINIFGTDPFK